jgi:hypothetical protein
MGINELAKLSGKITFFCPADIQTILNNSTKSEIENYIEKMVASLGTADGGFIAKWYPDPTSAGHSDKNVDTMSKKFIELCNNHKKLF